MKRFLTGALLAAAALGANAEILDISVGDNSFRGAFAGPLARLISGTNGQYDVGVTLRPRTDDDLLQLHAGVLLTGDAGAKSLDVAAGLGVRAIYTGRDNDSGGAIALGGQFETRVPSYNRFGFTGYGYYAPGVMSFGNVESYQEVGVALDYELIRGGTVYVGYRNIKQELPNLGPSATGSSKQITDNGAHIGFRLKF